ncbi:Hypothetical protein, putative [Bodo saltans]|uniref:C3H1-type domain-containing protein n=1 Tax=Bodo saltans TaxID=75058 RepID=A0A0S4J9F3_BODSA|nr:Hypothetical protein, putative [Bodo saltans]|eukprot:CUG86541.1 Hypothetical protein, putative [Bodo saltans]
MQPAFGQTSPQPQQQQAYNAVHASISGSTSPLHHTATSPHNGQTSSSSNNLSRRTSNGGQRYYSRDVASEPPTPIAIVKDVSDLDPHDPHCRFYILEQDLEPTEGWHTRQHKSQLRICFMHSFGKCLGRYQNDPATCHQVHVKQSVIEGLRSRYHHPVRRFFSRTIKARLQPELLSVISQVARKDLTLQYLEYLAHDVRETEGLHRYEQSYRAWLAAPGGFHHAFHETSVPQCTDFVLRGACALERQCPGVHAHLCRAQVRDAIVMGALRTISAPFDHTSGTASPSHDHEGSRRVSPTVSPRNYRAQGILSGQVSPVQQQTTPQHLQQHHQQQPQYHFQAVQQPPTLHAISGGAPTYVQLPAHPGAQFSSLPPGATYVQATTSPNHFDNGAPQYIPISPQGQQQGQPMYVVVLPQQQPNQGGGNGSGPTSTTASPQQLHLQPASAYQNTTTTLLLPQYNPASLESSHRSNGPPDDFQVRLDLGTLSGQTSPHSFIANTGGGDLFGPAHRSQSPNPHYQQQPQQLPSPQHHQPHHQIFPMSLSTAPPGSLWAPPPGAAAIPQQQQQPQTFVPSVYRVDQSSGYLVLEQHGQ